MTAEDGHYLMVRWWPRRRVPVPAVPRAVRPRKERPYEIEFQWKEIAIYWEGGRGVIFDHGRDGESFVTHVPDVVTWDRKVPQWLQGRHDEVVARLRAKPGHVVKEERDDSLSPPILMEVTRPEASG